MNAVLVGLLLALRPGLSCLRSSAQNDTALDVLLAVAAAVVAAAFVFVDWDPHNTGWE